MSECKEFLKRLKTDKAYKEMYSFVLEGFVKGELISLDAVLSRYYGKNPGAHTFDNWDTAILFDRVMSSLMQEGKVHIMFGKYVIDMPKEPTIVHKNGREER